MASHDAPKVSKQLQGTIISVRKAGGDPVELVGEVALRALKRKPGAVPVRALASRGDRGQSLPWGERIASHEGSSEWVLDAGRHNVASTGRAGSAERAALPQAAPARQVTPKQASPRQASPRQASPRQASPRQASPRQASPEHAAPERPSSPDHAASPDRTASTERESSAEPTGDERDDPGRRSTDSEDSTAPETHLPGTLTVEPQASIEADDVEDMPRTTPKFSERPSTADSWSRSTGRILDLLDKHSKFKRTALRARRRYFSNAWLATRLALWVVLLGVPIIVYPIAVFFESWSLRSQKYMASYGMALSNFCYILAPSLGASVRYTLEGIIGTMLALLNMLLLNQMTGSYMSGGAYQTRSEVLDPVTGATLYRSDWLPLCNLGNGARFVQTNSTADFMQNCFLNVHWSSLTPDAAKALIITLDLTIFHGVILWAGFGLCVRLYGFTYLAYWLMLFVTPTSDAFIENPSDPWTQAIMTCVGGCLAVLSQILPCPNDALSKATKSAAELVESVSAILEALPHASSEEVAIAIASALEAPQLWLQDIDEALHAAWFEDFGILPARSRRRMKLRNQVELMKSLLQHMGLAQRLGQQLTPADARALESRLPSLTDICTSAARAIPLPGTSVDKDAVEELEEALEYMQKEFQSQKQPEQQLSGNVLAFVLALCTISSGIVKRLQSLEQWTIVSPCSRCAIWTWLCDLASRLDLPQTRSRPSHLRFVFRSTLAMVLAFLFGWLGFERAMSAYNYGAAVTVAVVVANTTEAGFSLSLIMRRLNSAVIGTVLGQAAQQVLAVQTEFHATLYGIFLFCFAVFLIFQILHSKEHASTAMPVLGIGALALVPATGVFRVYNSQIEVEAEISLASSVKATVFGGTIMLIIDLLLYSSARSSAQKQLEKAMAKIQGLLSRVMGLTEKEDITENVDGSSNEEEKVLAYLNQVRGLLPHALAEPAPRGIEFPYALFSSVEGSLRTVASEMGTLEWMFDTLLAHSSSTALMGKEELAPLLSDIESYLTQMLSTVQVMYKDVSSRNFQPAGESGGDTAAGMLRQEILEKNYARISQAAKEIKPLVAQTRRLSGLAQAVLRNKDGNEGAGFPELLQRLRESSKDARGLTPMQDMLSPVELLVSILGTVSKQVVNIQLVLAQYG
ncbi:unnamed protein product [Effrenium voratum]|nr:unnamed protein product [Effrenium voratum]